MKAFNIGDRVGLHPACDEWMQGDKFGEVVGYGRKREYIDTFTKEKDTTTPIKVKLEVSGRVRRFHPDNLNNI